MKVLFTQVRKVERQEVPAARQATLAVPLTSFRCVASGRKFKPAIISTHLRPDDRTRCQGFVS
jgi:hypothetical protein